MLRVPSYPRAGRGVTGLAIGVVEFVRTHSAGRPRVVVALMAAELATPLLGLLVGREVALVWLASMWICAIVFKLSLRRGGRAARGSTGEVDPGARAEPA